MKYLYIVLLTIGILVTSPVLSQKAGPPDAGGDPESGGETPLGGAPIGGGTLILLALGAVYGGNKLYKLKEERKEE